MVNLKIDDKKLSTQIDKVLGQFAFLIQKELINRFPASFRPRIEVIKEASGWIIGSNYDILKFYELGTKPHIISPKVKKALAFDWPKNPKSGKHIYKKVRHPGTKGKHIIEDLEKDKALLQRLLEKAIRNVIK